MDEVALDNLTDCVGELIDKIRSKYPSLKQWQVYAVVSGLISNMNNGIDKPEFERELTNAVLRLNEIPMPNTQ